jgi:hypothetical protein
MLRRIGDSGVATAALTSQDFERTRELPDWPDVRAVIERKAPPGTVAPASSPVPVGSSPPPPKATPDSASRPAAGVRDATDLLVKLTSSPFAAGGLAYDVVSHRFVVGDLHGRKLMVVSEGADHPVDLVRAESAGFQEIKAVEIDSRRGDLWVASANGDDWTIHRMQLISGRPLKAVHASAEGSAVNLTDLAVTPAGTVLAIDSTGGRLLMLRPNGSSVETVVRLTVKNPGSVAATGDEDVVYVSHDAGIVRIDRKSKAVVKVSPPPGAEFGRIERLRWHRNALIVVQAGADGARRVVRFDLNRAGRAAVSSTSLDATIPAAAGPTFATVVGDELSYLVVENAAEAPTHIIIRRMHLP